MTTKQKKEQTGTAQPLGLCHRAAGDTGGAWVDLH
jgi:hypothetical protein